MSCSCKLVGNEPYFSQVTAFAAGERVFFAQVNPVRGKQSPMTELAYKLPKLQI